MKNANTSDGYAVMALPNEQALEDEKSLEIEAAFYLDCDTKDGSLRVFADRANYKSGLCGRWETSGRGR